MKKKIDIDLIIAFIDKKLDKETTKEVRSYIDNDNEWFLEYISLKQADYEIKNEELGDISIDPTLENPILSNNYETNNSTWRQTFIASVSAPFIALTPQISVGIMATIALISFYILQPFNYVYNTYNEESFPRNVLSTQFSEVTYNKDTVTISNDILSGEKFYIYIIIPKLMKEIGIGNTAYWNQMGYIEELESGSTITIYFDDIYKHYDRLFEEEFTKFELKIFIMDINDSLIDEGLINIK
jgi:hypothetical protein